MVLCPAFWEQPKKGPLHSDCPMVKRNKFVPDDHRVMLNQYGTFVHEFTHAYTHNWNTKEIYSPMDAVKLSAKLSLKNPNNFAFESSPPLSCLSGPNGFDRKLTEAS
ncbi:MAG: hypothetical protein L6R42_009956 [Xanthoria sp. 1 TBL-2021]|nr:MAG: hypothetical protein L6R42_009956 [Xanthoria sp. 1 TBL-2021]